MAASFPPWRHRLGGSWSLRYASCSRCRPLLRAWASGTLCTPSATLLGRRLIRYGLAPPSACQSWALMGGWCVGLCYIGVGVGLMEFLAYVVTWPRSSVYPLLAILGRSRCKTSLVAWLVWVVLLSAWRRVCIVEPFGVLLTVLAPSSMKPIHLPRCILENMLML
jgi:hypothetical protein